LLEVGVQSVKTKTALTSMKEFMVTMRNQIKYCVFLSVIRKRVTAKDVLLSATASIEHSAATFP
jgi:hypothetical protein